MNITSKHAASAFFTFVGDQNHTFSCGLGRFTSILSTVNASIGSFIPKQKCTFIIFTFFCNLHMYKPDSKKVGSTVQIVNKNRMQ